MNADPHLCEMVSAGLMGFLQAGFAIYPGEEGCVVVTPFELPDMASLEFTIERSEGGYLLTDGGQTLAELFVNGLTVEGHPELTQEVRRIARVHGIGFDASALSVQASAEGLGEAAHRLVSAIQGASYLVYKRSHRTRRTFDDEVEVLLLEHRVTYGPGYIVRGLASTHRIPFYVNSNRNVLLVPISAGSVSSAREKAKRTAYIWTDLRRANLPFRGVVVIDDKEDRWDSVWSDAEAFRPLQLYSDLVLRWTIEQGKLLGLVTELVS